MSEDGFDGWDLEPDQCDHTVRCLLKPGHKGPHRYKPRYVRPAPDIAADPGVNAAAIQADPRDTSEWAQWAVLPRTGSQRLAVLDFIIGRGEEGATHQEIRDGIVTDAGGQLSYSSSTTRPQELEKGGWIMDSGMRRETRAGNPAIVWVLSEEGRWKLKNLGDED